MSRNLQQRLRGLLRFCRKWAQRCEGAGDFRLAILSRGGLLLLACGGCEKAGMEGPHEPVVRWSGTTADSQGVTLVHNPGTPLFHGSGKTSLLRVLEFVRPPTRHDSATGNLPNPERIVAAHGTVAVLDQSAVSLDLFDLHSGRWFRRIGRKGEGPGEFEDPLQLFIYPLGVAVWDVGKGSLESYDSLGTYLATIRLPPMIGHISPLPNGKMWVWDFDGVATLWSRDDASLPARREAASRPLMRPPPSRESQDRCLYVGEIPGSVVVGRCTVPTIFRFTAEGVLQARVEVDRPPRTRSAAELARLQAAFASRMISSGLPDSIANMTAGRIVDKFAVERRFSHVASVHASGIVVMLEQLEPELEPVSANLHLFSRAGVYLADIPLPLRVVDINGGDEVFVMITEDPLSGVRTAAAYQIVLPQEVIEAGTPSLSVNMK